MCAITINRSVSNNTVLAFTATFSTLDFINTETTKVPAGSSKLPTTTGPLEDIGKKQLEDNSADASGRKSSILADLIL